MALGAADGATNCCRADWLGVAAGGCSGGDGEHAANAKQPAATAGPITFAIRDIVPAKIATGWENSTAFEICAERWSISQLSSSRHFGCHSRRTGSAGASGGG